jgi:hypothetical protein
VSRPFPAHPTRRDGPKVLIEERYELLLGVGNSRLGSAEQTRQVIARRRRHDEASEKKENPREDILKAFSQILMEREKHQATGDGALNTRGHHHVSVPAEIRL